MSSSLLQHMSGTFDDIGGWAGRLLNRFSGPDTGFNEVALNKMGSVPRAFHTAFHPGVFAATGAISVGQSAINSFTNTVEGAWNQRQDTFQSNAQDAGVAASGMFDMAFNAGMATSIWRRNREGVLGQAYARKGTGGGLSRMTPWGYTKGGAENTFAVHKLNNKESLYNVNHMEFSAESKAWTLKPGAVPLAGEGAEKSIKSFIKDEKLASGFLRSNKKFLGQGMMHMGYMGLQVAGALAVEYAVEKAVSIGGAIIDDNLNQYHQAKRIFRDDRQFNNPMMQMWQNQNYGAAQGAYESNSMSISRVYHQR